MNILYAMPSLKTHGPVNARQLPCDFFDWVLIWPRLKWLAGVISEILWKGTVQ